jgi:hypothetical protein
VRAPQRSEDDARLAPCLDRRLSQRKLAVARRRDGVAIVSIGWMACAVAHDPRRLLALDIAVDARHPGADLVREQLLTQGQNVIGPTADTGGVASMRVSARSVAYRMTTLSQARSTAST